MGYAEFSHALFRGELAGATGTADFKLTADAVDVVDTINIKNGSVAYQMAFRFAGNSSTNGGVIFQAAIPVHDKSVILEVSGYSNRAAHIAINGRVQSRFNANANIPFIPLITSDAVPVGTTTVQIIGNSPGLASGWLIVRYIRKTGGENG